MATFKVGEVMKRRQLHEQYDGSQQSGISSCPAHRLVLLFTGESGEKHGYHDGPQPDGTYWYTGEGQHGDMTETRGNKAIIESATDGRELHLFEQIGDANVRYVGRAAYLGHHRVDAPDTDGKPRKAIVFELEIDSSESAHVDAPDLRVAPPSRQPAALSRMTTTELRALACSREPVAARERRQVVRDRSDAVRLYVLRRANGVCEGCGNGAPFARRSDGSPYLEPHHTHRLADGGPDHPSRVAALCPNCHRRIHSGDDGHELNRAIAERIWALENGQG